MNWANDKAQRCCPEDSILEQWVRGRLDESTEATLVAHCDECERCEARLEEFERSLPVDRDLRACAYSPSVQDAPSAPMASLADSLPRRVDRLPEISGFRIIREIGRGGMGIVYEADQAALGRRVALKLLPPEFNQDETLVRRFESEAKAAAGFHHSNIVPVFQVGCEGDLHFFTMQLIDGVGFDQVICDLQNESNPVPGHNNPIHARVVGSLTLGDLKYCSTILFTISV